MTYAQTDRALTITTPLGPDALALTAVRGREAVSELFSYHLEMLSENHDITPEALVARPVTIGLRMADGRMRHIHGRIARLGVGWTTEDGLRHYQAEVVPWFAALQRVTDCRVFQNLSVPEIAQQIFARFGLTDFDTSLLTESHTAREYSVQFQESCYAYLCRLFEEEGIFFFFRHETDRHVLVLADTNAAFADGLETDLAYEPRRDEPGVVKSWFHRYAFLPFRLATGDYNADAPQAALGFANATLMRQLTGVGADAFERFEWPGGYATHEQGEVVVRRRLEEMEVGFHQIDGTSSCAGFAAGTRVRLADHPDREEKGRPYFLVSVEHQASDDSLLVGDGPSTEGEGEGYRYVNAFTACPVRSRVGDVDKHYRPARKTPKPRIHGTETAVVVGPAGETIHCDNQGRVKIQFHWDRHGAGDDSSSCWVRVSQEWAGSRFGTTHVPHVGHEVLVSFLEGDPDRPVIVGRVHNANQKNPLLADDLARKTQTLRRDHGGNQILTEGQAGAQRIHLRSPTANTHIEIGALSATHPAASLMARFQAAFPTAMSSATATATASTSTHASTMTTPTIITSMVSAPVSTTPTIITSQASASPTDTPAITTYSADSSVSSDWDTAITDIESGVSISTESTLWTQCSESYVFTSGDVYTITQGDMYTGIEGNSTGYVGGNVNSTLFGNTTTNIHGNNTSTTDGDVTTNVVGNTSATTLGAATTVVAGNAAAINVGMAETLFVGGYSNVNCGLGLNINILVSYTYEFQSYSFTGGSSFKFENNKFRFAVAQEEISTELLAFNITRLNAIVNDNNTALTKMSDSVTKLEQNVTSIVDDATKLESNLLQMFTGIKINI